MRLSAISNRYGVADRSVSRVTPFDVERSGCALRFADKRRLLLRLRV
jgi:hypothetical protein